MRALLLLSALLPLLPAQTTTVYTVKESDYPLRAGCSGGEGILAKLKQGDPIKIRFALSGNGRTCYAVAAEVSGKMEQGYVWADALTGLEAFEQARRAASATALPPITRSVVEAVRESSAAEGDKSNKTDYALAAEVFRAADALQSGRPADAERILAKAGAPRSHRDAAVVRAAALLDLNQADRALEVLEPALREHQRDPQLLALAGMACHKLDDPRRALEYWRESLEIHPDPSTEQMYRKVEKEIAGDKSGQKSYGTRFLLRYDGQVADPELARSMVAVLDDEFTRISFELGCPAEQRIVTIVQSPEAYYKTTGAAEWSGGQYDGKIRIPFDAATRFDGGTRRSFAHEIVHACLANLGRWPRWLHEGMAQKLSGGSLDLVRRQRLKALAAAANLPKLEALGNNWSGLSNDQVAVNYALSLAAVELFFQKYSQYGARNLMNNPESLPQIAAELDRGLEEELRN